MSVVIEETPSPVFNRRRPRMNVRINPIPESPEHTQSISSLNINDISSESISSLNITGISSDSISSFNMTGTPSEVFGFVEFEHSMMSRPLINNSRRVFNNNISVRSISASLSSINHRNINASNQQINHNGYVNPQQNNRTRYRKWIKVQTSIQMRDIVFPSLENVNIISWISIKARPDGTAQAFIYLKKQQTYGSTIQNLFNDRHMTIQTILKSQIKSKYNAYDWGTDYCDNHNILYYEWNSQEDLPFGSTQNKQEQVNAVKKFVRDVETYPDMPNNIDFMERFPVFACTDHLMKCFKQQKKVFKKEKREIEDAQYLQRFIARFWQKQIFGYVDHMLTIGENRNVLTLLGRPGAEGKSTTARIFECLYPGKVLVIPGFEKSSDFAHILNKWTEENGVPKIVIVDEPKMKIGLTDYSILEALKNGRVFCPKYDSLVLRFRSDQIPIVILFTNGEIPNNIWSSDRYDSMEIMTTDAHHDGEIRRLNIDFSDLPEYDPNVEIEHYPIPQNFD